MASFQISLYYQGYCKTIPAQFEEETNLREKNEKNYV